MWYMYQVQCKELRINHCPTLSLVVIMPSACWSLWQSYYIEDFSGVRLHFEFGIAF